MWKNYKKRYRQVTVKGSGCAERIYIIYSLHPYILFTQARPLTMVEDRRIKEGIPKETVVKESFCRMRQDGIAVLPPVGNKAGIFCILEHKRMSDVFERYLIRAKSTAEAQYASLRSAISTVIHRQGWKVEQVSFITGA